MKKLMIVVLVLLVASCGVLDSKNVKTKNLEITTTYNQKVAKRVEYKLHSADSTGTSLEFAQGLETLSIDKGQPNWITWNDNRWSYHVFIVDANKNLTNFGQMWAFGATGMYITYKLKKNTDYYLWFKSDQRNNPIDVYVLIRK